MRLGWFVCGVGFFGALSACSLLTDVNDLRGAPDAATDVAFDASDEPQDVATVDVVNDVATESAVDAAFDPSFFGNLELWLSADVGADSDAGDVTQWTDRSPQKRSVVSPTADAVCQTPPTFVPGALHGMPMVDFNGATQCMTISGAFGDFTLGFTAFAVFQPGNCNSSFTGNGGALFDSRDDANTNGAITIGRNYAASPNTASGDAMLSLSTITVGSATSVEIVGGSSWVPATAELLTFHLPAAPGGTLVSGTAFVDGVVSTLGTNDPLMPDKDVARTASHLGYNPGSASSYSLYCGRVGELLVYSKSLSDTERQSVEGYLKTRWTL